MTLNYADRVVDVSSTTGTGNVTVSGTPPTGYRPLSDIALGQFEYVIENAGLTEWEVGIGTRLDAVTFSRDTVARSSNAGALVSFAAGIKTVTHSLSAEGLALFARTADPTFTGVPAAPTAATATNTTQIATTAFVTAANAGKQPLDSDLTAIAALVTTAYGRSLLTQADAAALRQAAGITGGAFGVTVDGGGSPISTGQTQYRQIPFACTITKWTLLADVAGSCVMDVWSDTFGNFPPTVADTITGTDKPTLVAQAKNSSVALTGWNTSVPVGNVLMFNIDSISGGISKLTLAIDYTI